VKTKKTKPYRTTLRKWRIHPTSTSGIIIVIAFERPDPDPLHRSHPRSALPLSFVLDRKYKTAVMLNSFHRIGSHRAGLGWIVEPGRRGARGALWVSELELVLVLELSEVVHRVRYRTPQQIETDRNK